LKLLITNLFVKNVLDNYVELTRAFLIMVVTINPYVLYVEWKRERY